MKLKPKKINQVENDKSLLQQQVLELRKENYRNQIDSEENKQYRRRLCLRKDSIHIEEKETSNAMLDKVAKMWMEAGVHIFNEVVDRDHRIGPSYIDKNTNAQCKTVIVLFTTFRHRTMVYRPKKKMKSGMRKKLDIMKSKYTLLNNTDKIVNLNQMLNSVMRTLIVDSN